MKSGQTFTSRFLIALAAFSLLLQTAVMPVLVCAQNSTPRKSDAIVRLVRERESLSFEPDAPVSAESSARIAEIDALILAEIERLRVECADELAKDLGCTGMGNNLLSVSEIVLKDSLSLERHIDGDIHLESLPATQIFRPATTEEEANQARHFDASGNADRGGGGAGRRIAILGSMISAP
ncbi:MAG: hypothetical protein NUW37_16505 [Planctomycetes bacterium]|nr:hypothetical protein [Planctomycetota bacterium]